MRFTRTDTDGAGETLRIVTFDDGETYYSAALERESPYVVQITTGPDAGDDFVGLCSLDGDPLRIFNRSWTLAKDVPEEVIRVLEQDWETERLA
ncbi:MAG: hypothetical protein GWN84_05265 [Gammaproteobacteria bacterium]|nr:hypothetical protein [Gammaproteobacteria bacterium]NIR82371.1 hypothetical protein [Gammaproteobacteria bacterium]NIU03516.1 hypothetical protein [Gammaproteobacteria bacterium]NIX84790.1 hypothetical protein [Gammaproteobacteria bacterium]